MTKAEVNRVSQKARARDSLYNALFEELRESVLDALEDGQYLDSFYRKNAKKFDVFEDPEEEFEDMVSDMSLFFERLRFNS